MIMLSQFYEKLSGKYPAYVKKKERKKNLTSVDYISVMQFRNNGIT